MAAAKQTRPEPPAISPLSPWHLRETSRCLRGGGVIAYPTEAVYGLGCDPLNPRAVQRLLELKQRPLAAGLILIAADFSQIEPFLDNMPPALRLRVTSTWPGPVTWLLPARPETPTWLRGQHTTLAVRVTAHPGSAALCRAFGGALVSTSANPRGREPARTWLQIRRYFHDSIDYCVPGPLGERQRPSEIRDARTGKVLRSG